MAERFNLKLGDRTVATLVANPNGKIILEHELTVEDLDPVLTVDPVDKSNQPLTIEVGNIRPGVDVVFHDAAKTERLAIGYDKYGYLDVVDPKKIAGLQEVPWPSPIAGEQPSVDGDSIFVLNLGPFEKARVYCERVLQLYEQIELWVKGTPLKTLRRRGHTLIEEALGRYETFLLEIYDAARKLVATVTPTGASVIGAEGRVELRGRIDREGIVYFPAGGPQYTVRIGAGPSAKRVSRQIFKGVDKEGWYWLESAHLSRARPLDEALFKDLLRGVSDYYELSAP